MTPRYASEALTLADYAMQSRDPVQMKITKTLLGDFNILDDLPLVTNGSLIVKGRRITGDDLPSTGWGRINKAPDAVKTTVRPYEEQASLVREIIPVDRRLLRQKDWIDDPIDTQISGVMEAHRYDMNWAFFHNDPSGPANAGNNPDAWVGIKARLANAEKYGLAGGLTLSGGDLTPGVTNVGANDFHEKMAQALAILGSPDGEGVIAYTNWLVKERWARAIRMMNGGGGFAITKDAFDREVERYRKVVVRDAGFRKDQVTPLISDSLDVNGKEVANQGGDYSEIILVRMGDKHMKGWQTEELKPERLGRSTETGIFENVLIDWGCGLCHPTNRPFVRIHGLKVRGS